MTKPHRPHRPPKQGQKTRHGQTAQGKQQQHKEGPGPQRTPRKASLATAGQEKEGCAPFPDSEKSRAQEQARSQGQVQGQVQGQNRAQEQVQGQNRAQPGKHPTASGFDPIDTHDEDDSHIALLPGVKPVLEMLTDTPERIDTVFIRKGRHGKEMDEILDRCREAGVRFSLLEPSTFAKQVGQGQSQGVAARLFEAGFTPFETLLDTIMDAPLPLLVALDQVQDPGNAGTLARTLFALGGAGLVIPRHNSVYLGAGAAKAAAGALQKLPVAKVGSLSQAIDTAKKMGITIYGAAADAQASVPVSDLLSMTPRFPALLLLGSEEKGIRQTLVKRCHSLVSIPMQRDFDSLNVAQAGAICIAFFLRHHLGKG